MKGTKQDDGTVIFTGLTPNTSYTVEVRAEYKDNNGNTKYAYAYVYDTTKPVYKATVKTFLDGTLTDIFAIHGEDVTLYLHEDDENAEYIPLTQEKTGVYTASVQNGIYYPWHIEDGNHYHQAREYKLIIQNANGELNLHHYSVSYDTNGGAFIEGEEVTREVFSSGSSVAATKNIPVKDGYVFAGWEYVTDGAEKIIYAGENVTSNITAPITLTAKWEKEVNVTINVTIDHRYYKDGVTGYDHNDTKDELLVEFLEMKKDSPAFVETGDKLTFTKEKVTDEKGNPKQYNCEQIKQNGEILETIYTATAATYTGLLESSFFGVALSKSGYDVGEITKEKDESGNWTINIPLRYNPDDFDLDFSVEMAEDVPEELYPDAVIVKIACWDDNENEWIIISQQRTTDTTVRPGIRVDIDPETGKGSGSYPVWKHKEDGSVYGYRAVVTGFIYDDSTIIVPTEKDHTIENGKVVVTYTDGNYTATMGDISDGQRFGTSLNGAYYNDETNGQQGTLDGVISVEKYNVTFDAQGGKVNSKDKDISENQYYIPSFKGYQPVMEGHNFLGWYLDTECKKPATAGVLLTEDITLYAKWDRILTGNLIVDGYYTDKNGDMHIVNIADRATHALIELEEITNDGTYNIAGQTVEIRWLEDKHFSEPVYYSFDGLNPDKEYRIDVYLINYEAAYQNLNTLIDGNGDIHNDYNETDYKAIYTDEGDYKYETYVNSFLHFEPEVFFQDVEVDTSLIGEAFRPDSSLVEYLGREVGTDKDYNIIVQHKTEPFGVEVAIDKATGKNDINPDREDGKFGCEVWKKIFNGNLYDYQANLTKLGGKSVEEFPVIVVYGESARWSPYNQEPTSTLKVTVMPKWYDFIYDLNDGSGDLMKISRAHNWSHETKLDLTYVPVREGYNFLGWYEDASCTIKASDIFVIDAEVQKDITVYAKWEPASYEYTVNYLEKDTDKVLAPSKNSSATYLTEVNEEAIAVDGYTVSDESNKSIVIDTENNVINFYYTANSYGYTVNYLEKDTDKVLAPSKNSTATYLTEVSEEAIAIDGFTVSGESIKNIVIDTENNVINFYYTANSYGYTVKYLEEGTNNVLAAEKHGDLKHYGQTVTETAIYIKGYTAEIKNKDLVIGTENNIIIFYYSKDEIGLYDDDKGKDYGDETPDKYQKKVIFKVVNGSWSNGSKKDIVKVLTLTKDGKYDINGTASLVAPTGMKADNGYIGGKWDVAPPSTVSGTDTEVFTYSFEKDTSTEPGTPDTPDTPDVPDTPDTPDVPDTPDTPEVPGGNGNTEAKHHIVFGKTDGIGWYNVSKDGGQTWDIVFGNSTYEVENGTELIIKAGDLLGDSFTFYVNGDAVKPDDDGAIKVTVKGYMLIGAIGIDPDIDFEVPDVEESLNWFQKIIKAIKDFFAWLFGKK